MVDDAPDVSMAQNTDAPPVSADVPLEGAGLSSQSDPAPPSFNIPDDYKEKGWAKNIGSEQDLWKMLDNSQEMIGKKQVIPDLSDEKAREEYFAQLRPESPDEYELPESYGEEINKFYSDAFHKAGLSKEQASTLVEMHQQLEQQSTHEQYSKDAFDSKLKETFGDNYEKESSKILAHMKTMMTPAQKELFNTAPNDSVVLMMQYTKKMMEEYGANEGTSNSGNNNVNAPSGEQIKEQRDTLYQQLQDLSKRPHSAKEKEELMQKYTATFR